MVSSDRLWRAPDYRSQLARENKKSEEQFALSAFLYSKMQLQILLLQFKAQLAVRSQYILGQLQLFLNALSFHSMVKL